MSASAWDAHASTYARLFTPLTEPMAASMLRLACHLLPADAAILDVACGPGAVALPAGQWACAAGRTGRVVATDFSPGMVALAAERVASAGLADVVRCAVHDGMALDLPDASFDGVFSSFGIFLFPDRAAGWREAARVLKPGGVFATTSWRGPEHNPMMRAQVGPVVAAMPERLRQAPARSWMEIAEPDALAAEIGAAGFVDVTVRVLWGTLVLPSARDTWRAMFDNPCMGALLRACDAPELAAVEASVVGSLAALAGGEDAPFTLDASCHVVVARKPA